MRDIGILFTAKWFAIGFFPLYWAFATRRDFGPMHFVAKLGLVIICWLAAGYFGFETWDVWNSP